jgi:hypothetical protein
MRRGASRHAVGQEVRGGRTNPRDQSQEGSDGGALQQGEGVTESVSKPIPQRAFQPTGPGDGAAFQHHVNELGDREQTDHDGHKADAVEQIDRAEGVALDAEDRVDADQADGDSERANARPG